MDDERNSELLIRAVAAYKGVVANPKEFGPVAVRLVDDARRAGDAEALVAALRAEAWFERARLADERAKRLLDEAVRVATRQRLGARLAEVLVTRAAVNHELGRLAAAQRDLDRAASLAGGGRSPELELQQAALLQNMGHLSEAAAIYRRVLALPDPPPPVAAIMANNLALIEVQHGHHDVALDRLDHAAKLAQLVGPAVVALVAQSRGWAMVQAGRLTESLRVFEDAASLYEAAGLSLGEHYLEHVDALVDLRLLPEASELARRAVEQFEAQGVRLMGAEAQLRTAQLALLSGDHPTAVAAAEAASQSFRSQRRGAWAARATVVGVQARARGGEVAAAQLVAARRAAATLERLGIVSSAVDAYLVAGRVAVLLGRAGVARRSLSRASELAAGGPVLTRLKGRVAGALRAQTLRDDRAAVEHCRAGLSDLTRHRAALPSMELRALASGHGAELGRWGLEVLLRTGSAQRVLEWMERTRSAALLAVEPPVTEGIEDQLAALWSVHAELAHARREQGTEPAELLAEQAGIEARIRRDAWARQASVQVDGRLTPPAELRRLLGGQVLVEYGILDGELLAVVLEPRRTRLVRLAQLDRVRFETDALLFALRRLARAGAPASLAAFRASADAGLRRLAELLLHPLGLDRDAPLVVVPPTDLQRLPWPALHPGPVAVAPSGSFWARTARPRPERPAGGGVVLVAGPDLPGAAAEIEVLRSLHDRPIVLAPPASTVRAVAGALDGAALAHLACHGRLRADNPTFSSLQLSDGPLTVHELHLRGLAPRRMILASCESGADVSYEGNEMLGFVSALIARGTAGLVASSVMVPDLEAVQLMRALHARVAAGAPLAAGLHAARATLDRDDPGGFVSWCAFTAFGGS
jgi:tetratricopeptide (TPR) repeat protein